MITFPGRMDIDYNSTVYECLRRIRVAFKNVAVAIGVDPYPANQADINLHITIAKTAALTVNPTTASATFATIPEMKVSLLTHGNPVLLIATVTFSTSVNTQNALFQFFRDGGSIGPTYNSTSVNAAQAMSMSMSFLDFSSNISGPHSHTYELRWSTTGGMTVTAVGVNRILQVMELLGRGSG